MTRARAGVPRLLGAGNVLRQPGAPGEAVPRPSRTPPGLPKPLAGLGCLRGTGRWGSPMGDRPVPPRDTPERALEAGDDGVAFLGPTPDATGPVRSSSRRPAGPGRRRARDGLHTRVGHHHPRPPSRRRSRHRPDGVHRRRPPPGHRVGDLGREPEPEDRQRGQGERDPPQPGPPGAERGGSRSLVEPGRPDGISVHAFAPPRTG